MLTTNLVRAGALRTDATKLGRLTALQHASATPDVAASLTASAASLGVAHGDVDVLVAHRRDYSAARKLGMRPRLVAELRSAATAKVIGHATPDRESENTPMAA